VDLRWFRPPRRWVLPWTMSHRTHRKVLLCDGVVGFTGGVGVGEEWEGDARHPGEWRETHFRVQGPVLRGLEAAFVGNWLEVAPEDEVVSRISDGPDAGEGTAAVQVVRSSAAIAWSDMATLLHTLLSLAQSRVRISTPYFVPDDPTVARMMAASRRGVSVELLVPGEHIDHRVAQVSGEDHYETLLDAGVRISEYVPTMIHQKITVVDSTLVAIGSGNLNQRSLHQDDEIQLVVDDPDFCRRIDEMLDEDWSRSEPVQPGQWKRRGWLQRVAETATRPFRNQF
jgi:cardiolipin synthase